MGTEFYDWPVYGGQRILGVVRIPVEAAAGFGETQKAFLHSMLECVALAMDRILAVQEQAPPGSRYSRNGTGGIFCVPFP